MEHLQEKVKTVVFPVFSEYRVVLVVSSDIDASFKKRHGILGTNYNLAGCEAAHQAIPGKMKAFLFFRPGATNGTVAHECWHTIHKMFGAVGACLDNEAVAYHLGYLVDKTTDLITGYLVGASRQTRSSTELSTTGIGSAGRRFRSGWTDTRRSLRL